MVQRQQQRLDSNSIRLDRHTMTRMRDLVRFLRAHGQPDATLVGTLTTAAQQFMRHIELTMNDGQSLPPTTGPLRATRTSDAYPADDPMLPYGS